MEEKWRWAIDELRQKKRQLQENIEDTRRQMKEENSSFKAHQEAIELVRSVAREIQETTKAVISARVSDCLAAVFDDPYSFELVTSLKRGQTEVKLVFRKNGEEFDPITETGGGVLDVASFALRLSCLLLHKPPVRRLLVLDEPFKFVSRDKLKRVALLIKKLAEELDFQIILITHIPELHIGNVIEL